MRIAVVGCGAMGTAMGAYMTKNGCPVDMIARRESYVKVLNEKGVKVTGYENFTAPVKAILEKDMEGIYDIVYLATKQTAYEDILPKLVKHLGPDSVVCAMQNGVPEPYAAQFVGMDRTVGCTMLWGSTLLEPGVVQITTDIAKRDHIYELGEVDGKITDRIKKVAEPLEKMGGVHITENLMDTRWCKLVLNACMSGMSAACGSPYGPILDNPRAKACLSYLAYEVKLCCEADGHSLSSMWGDRLDLGTPEKFEISQKAFLDRYNTQREGKASMLQDLEIGRGTEVTMINGYVCKMGDKYGIDTPYHDAVVDIVQRMERKELPLSIENVQYFPDITY